MKNILIIQFGRMGDLLQTIPSLYFLLQKSPDSSLTLLCIREYSPIMNLFEIPLKIISLAEKDYLEFSRKITPHTGDLLLQNSGLPIEWDFIINLSHCPLSAHILNHLSAPSKSGRVETLPNETRIRGYWGKYLYATTHVRKDNLLNLVDLQSFMCGIFPPLPPLPFFPPSLPPPADIPDGAPLIALHLGANKSERKWPLDYFILLSVKLLTLENFRLVLIGDRHQTESAAHLKKALPDERILDMTEKTDLPGLAALLQKCRLLISSDSGPVHVAAALKIPCLVIYFGPAYFAETSPYGAGHFLLQSETTCTPCKKGCLPKNCLKLLSPEIVFHVVSHILLDTPLELEGKSCSLYKTGFDSNNLLAYTPIHVESPGLFYRASILKALRLTEFGLASSLSCFSDTGIFKKVRNELLQLHEVYEKTLQLLKNNRDTKNIPLILMETEKKISNLSETPDRFFHSYEMMDMENQTFPAILEIILLKFTHQKERLERYLAALDS